MSCAGWVPELRIHCLYANQRRLQPPGQRLRPPCFASVVSFHTRSTWALQHDKTTCLIFRGLILLEAQALGACTPERLGAFLPPGDGATRSE